MPMHKTAWCTCIAVACVMLAAPAWAKPAPWFWWESRHDGQRVCAQAMPAQGWRKLQGPFHNAQCQPQAPAPRVPGR